MDTVPEGEELWNLRLVITLNKIRAKGNFFRAARRDVRRNAGAEFSETDSALAADNEQALQELQEVVNELLAQLPPIYADIVSLRIAGHDLDAIAAQTKRSRRTVERALQEFRNQLSALLNEEK
jgi:RNA polymerase sigma-70 factor (ECF subfamily)